MNLSAPAPSLAVRSPYRVELVEDAAGFAGLRDEWNTLLESGPCDVPFLRHEWIAAWLSAFAPSAPIKILAARARSGKLVGLAPFLEERRFGLTRLVAPANDHSCRFEWILGPDVIGAVTALWTALCELRWDVILLRDLPRDGPTSIQLGALATAQGFLSGRWESMRTPYLVLGARPVEEQISAKFRANLRRRAKRLAEKGPVAFTRIDGANGLDQALEDFFALEAAGWKGRRGTAIARDPHLLQFYRDVAHAAAQGGWLALRSIEVGGRRAAMHFAFIYRDRYFLPKPAYDERLASCSPGQLLLREVVSECESRGLAEFDFLGPDMPWKRDWEPLHRPHDWLYVYRPGLAGQALFTLKHRMKPLAREVLSWWR